MFFKEVTNKLLIAKCIRLFSSFILLNLSASFNSLSHTVYFLKIFPITSCPSPLPFPFSHQKYPLMSFRLQLLLPLPVILPCFPSLHSPINHINNTHTRYLIILISFAFCCVFLVKTQAWINITPQFLCSGFQATKYSWQRHVTEINTSNTHVFYETACESSMRFTSSLIYLVNSLYQHSPKCISCNTNYEEHQQLLCEEITI